MNALAHYLLLLDKVGKLEVAEAEESRRRAKDLYSRLEEIDEDRKQRYRDMAARC